MKGFERCQRKEQGWTACENAAVSFVFPSLGKMISIAEKGQFREKCWEHHDQMHMRGPGEEWWEKDYPRAHFSQFDMPWVHRQKCAHHCKIFCGFTAQNDLVWQYSGALSSLINCSLQIDTYSERHASRIAIFRV